MSQVPARLVYTDSNSNEVIIGEFQPQNPTQGNISTFTIEENAKNYKRVIVEGGPTLDERMPTTLSEFGTDEPEIRVEQDPDFNGTWSQRLRVYPEESGSTDEQGRYKNKNLWGFKKYYGEDDVETGTITSNLEAAANALLPSGYTIRYPNDVTAPNVTGYSFKGSRQKGFQELQRDYKHYIIFTDETDGSGNFYVDLQPFGYGGTQFSLTRGQDPLVYDYWKQKDNSNIYSKVKVVGKDSTGAKIERIVAAGSPNGVHGSDTENPPDSFVDADSITAVDTSNNIFTVSGDKLTRYFQGSYLEVFDSTGNDGTYKVEDVSLVSGSTEITVEENISDSTADGSLVPKPDKRRFRQIQVDYTITETEADDIAKNIIEPHGKPNGKIETNLATESDLNDSVGLLDNSRNIDDIYTVVHQKDFLHQGVTTYSFEFEQEATDKQRGKWREHDSERAKVYPGSITDVGEQTLSDVTTGQATSDTNVSGSLDEEITGQNIAKATVVVPPGFANSNLIFTVDVPEILAKGGTQYFFQGAQLTITVNNFDNETVNWNYTVTNTDEGGATVAQSGTSLSSAITSEADTTDTVRTFLSPTDVSENDTLDINLDTPDSSLFTSMDSTEQTNEGAPFGLTTVEIVLQAVESHQHTDSYDTNDNNHGGVQQGTSAAHGIEDENDPVNNDPKTDTKNVDTIDEVNTSR